MEESVGKKREPKKLVGSYFVSGDRLGRIISVTGR